MNEYNLLNPMMLILFVLNGFELKYVKHCKYLKYQYKISFDMSKFVIATEIRGLCVFIYF